MNTTAKIIKFNNDAIKELERLQLEFIKIDTNQKITSTVIIGVAVFFIAVLTLISTINF
jgi:hypothetical protein